MVNGVRLRHQPRTLLIRMRTVTIADLCEEADTILSMRFDGEYLEGDVYSEKAQWMFEDILSDLERGLIDKGYTFSDGEWTPPS